LPLRASTQRRGWLVVIFQLSLANKELLWNSIERSPKPPKAFGEHILSQERKERLWFLSCGKPHQNFRIKVLISNQKYLGRRKRDIIYVWIAFAIDLTRVVLAAWDKRWAFQPVILAKIWSLSSIKVSFFFRCIKRGMPRYFALVGIKGRFKILLMDLLTEWRQFLLKNIADLDKFMCCPNQRE
jgi:hypothetical protein